MLFYFALFNDPKVPGSFPIAYTENVDVDEAYSDSKFVFSTRL